MLNRDFILGIDTSNYKTSLALTDLKGDILFDSRKSLIVKQGERGLQQSHALFQHMDNLPELAGALFRRFQREQIGAVAVSNRPRPVNGSYMPVFKAGINFGKVIADCLSVPYYEFSHQEGHIAAVRHNSIFSDDAELLVYHLSGGTCELLFVRNGRIEIVGGSKDLSFGQVIDRIGVSLGMAFPAGEEMDKLAVESLCSGGRSENAGLLTRIPINDLSINLSGLETQCRRNLENGALSTIIITELFSEISRCLCELTAKAVEKTGCRNVLFAGGVSSSTFIRESLSRCFSGSQTNIFFGKAELSTDNAVGISLLGGNHYGNQTNQGFTA